MQVTSSRQNHVTNLKYISTTRVSLATKLGKMVTCFDKLLPIKSYDPLIPWSCEITWHTKTITSPLPQCLWPPNLTSWWLTLRGSYPQRYSTIWSRGLTRSLDKLKQLYLYYHDAYCHQTWSCVTYHEGIPLIKSHDDIIKWSWKFTWQTKNIIYPLPQYLWPQNSAGW